MPILVDRSTASRPGGREIGGASHAATSGTKTASASSPNWTGPRSASSWERSSCARGFEHRSYGHIYDLFVDPAQRNRGVGESLVNEALAWFRSRRVEKVDLYAHMRNEMGLRFWKKMGFEPTVHILDRRI